MPALSMKHSERNEKMSQAQIFESHEIIPASDRVWECKLTRAEGRNRESGPFLDDCYAKVDYRNAMCCLL